MRLIGRSLAWGIAFLLCLGSPLVLANDLETVTVELTDVPRIFRLDGVAEAVNSGTVSAQTSGRVTEVNFDVDDFVEAGSLLVKLENRSQKAAVTQAEANLKAARSKNSDALKEYNRIKGVYAKKLVSKAEMDRATAGLQQARAGAEAASAALERAQQELDYTEVKAPYNGIVTERLIEVGETAQPGKPLMSGLSLDTMRVSVDVPQNLVDSIRTERKAQAKIGNQWVSASDVTVFPVADPRSDTFKVRLRLPEGLDGVFPGMYVKVGFVAGSQKTVTVPLSSVVFRSEVVGVYVVGEDGHVFFRHIRVGSPAGPDRVAVLSGLKEGEHVAVDPVAAGILLKSQRTGQVDNG